MRDPSFDWQEGLVTLEDLVTITRWAIIVKILSMNSGNHIGRGSKKWSFFITFAIKVGQSLTFPLWAYREKFNINFWSQNFAWLLHMYIDFKKKLWAKMSMLNFSRWLRNRRSSLK